MSKRIAAVILVSLIGCVSASAREGFGFTKKAAEMNVRAPPGINVSGTRVALSVKGERAHDMERSIADLIERAGTALRVGTPADITVTVDVDRLDVDHRSNSKVEYRSEKRCCDKNGKTYYKSVPHDVYYTTVDARLDGRYKITDARGRLLDDGSIPESSLHDSQKDHPTTSKT